MSGSTSLTMLREEPGVLCTDLNRIAGELVVDAIIDKFSHERQQKLGVYIDWPDEYIQWCALQ